MSVNINQIIKTFACAIHTGVNSPKFGEKMNVNEEHNAKS